MDGTVETLTLEQWEKIFALNVTSIFLMSKYILAADAEKRLWADR